MEIGNVDVDVLGFGLELLIEVFTECVGNVGVNRLQ